jgi:hypothetical protein
MNNVLTIERSKWRRGGDSDELVSKYGLTYLLNDEGFMCCLGFDAVACGFSAADITYKPDPAEFSEFDLGKFLEYAASRVVSTRQHDDEDDHDYTVTCLTEAANNAVMHNDDPKIDEQTRERLIRADLIALGWDDVVFID